VTIPVVLGTKLHIIYQELTLMYLLFKYKIKMNLKRKSTEVLSISVLKNIHEYWVFDFFLNKNTSTSPHFF